jgi:pyrroline-5-carboxylate reductase
MTTTTFIGAGHIAQALIGGYLATNPDRLIASDPLLTQLEQLPEKVERSESNRDTMAGICSELKDYSTGKLFISVAAGITTESMMSWLGEESAIIRCMPNTPALVGKGMTGLFANPKVSSNQRDIAEQILGSVGKFHWFDDENSLDVVTAISGSGPAYYFLVMETMQKAGIKLGLPPEVSRKLVLQTALGAAQMALESDLSTEQLRINVTSPGGTTQAALTKMIEADLSGTLIEAIDAAYERSKQLSKEVQDP